MKRTITMIIAVLVICTMLIPASGFASDGKGLNSEETYIIDSAKYHGNTCALERDIEKAIQKEDHIKIINLDQHYEGMEVARVESNNSENLKSAQGPIYYKVDNIKKKSNTYGADYLNVAGDPGVTIGLSDARTKSYSITFGATYGCPTGKIANATWGTTKARTLTYQGTWKVPAKHNNKKVKKGRLHMRPEYSVKQYTIYSMVSGYTNWTKKGTSTTKRAYGVDIYKTYTYK